MVRIITQLSLNSSYSLATAFFIHTIEINIFRRLFFIIKSNQEKMDLFELLKNESVQIIDVRTESEYQGGHVKNSRNIPVDQVPKFLEEFSCMCKPIVLCCASGARSGMATEYLSKAGVQEVYNGGSWKNIELQKLR